MRYAIWNAGYLLLLFLLAAGLLAEPCLIVCGADGTLVASAPAIPGTPVSLRFLHSVQKTPVEENLVWDGSSFRLVSTRYQSFGVGLPFLESEGEFRREGDFYVMDKMDRRFPRLALRTGTGTRLSLRLRGREHRLHEQFPPGTEVDLFVAPLCRLLQIYVFPPHFAP